MLPQQPFSSLPFAGAPFVPGVAPEPLRVFARGRLPFELLADLDVELVDDPSSADVVLAEDGFSRYDRPVVALIVDRSGAAEAIAAGARGVVLRGSPAKRIQAAIAAVAEGLFVTDDRNPAESMVEPLTNREAEVMQLLAAGRTNKEIASRLGISEHTVKFHVNGILGKLGVDTRTEAVVAAARLGLVVL
jgi:DNA-binding CsgD family transcriptional regulator